MKGVAAVLMTMSLAACATPAAQPERPAVIVNPTESRSELLDVLRQALNGRPLTIADDALTQDSLLIIERARPSDSGRLLDGRELEMPERFRLVTHAATCTLIHERTGRSWMLKTARCKPIQ